MNLVEEVYEVRLWQLSSAERALEEIWKNNCHKQTKHIKHCACRFSACTEDDRSQVGVRSSKVKESSFFIQCYAENQPVRGRERQWHLKYQRYPTEMESLKERKKKKEKCRKNVTNYLQPPPPYPPGNDACHVIMSSNNITLVKCI